MKKYLVILLLLSLFYFAQAQQKKNTRPNIIWLVSEDNSPFLGCYGDTYANTPYLDKLASEGVLFEQAFSNAPVSAPSRSTLITGVYSTTMGTENMRSQYPVPDFIRLFPEYLRKAGYYTVNKAKTDYNMSPLEDRMNGAWDDSSLKATYKNRKPGQPFFAMYNSSITHESSLHSRKDSLKHDPDEAPIPPYHPRTPEMEHDWAQYYDRVEQMDNWAGSILEELEREGLAENTIVFYFSDHGGVLGRSKRFLYEAGLHVPLIIRIPKKFTHLVAEKAGTRSSRMVSFIDFAPTVLSLAGIPIPEYMQGEEFLGKIKDRTETPAYGYRGRMDAGVDLSRTVRKGKYRYIRNYMPHKIWGQYIEYLWKAPSMPSWENAYNKKQLNAVQSAFWESKPFEELYDCEADPHNIYNLAHNESYEGILEQMRMSLDNWQVATNDLGFIPEPMIEEISKTISLYEWAKGDRYPLVKILETASAAASGDTKTLPLLMERLRDKNAVVRYWAATGCRILKTKAQAAKPLLLEMANHDDEISVRNVAAEALYYLGEQKIAVEVLSRSVSSPDIMIRVQSLNILQQFGQDALPVLPLAQKILDIDPKRSEYDVSAAKGFIRAMEYYKSNGK
ncbi:sulfatase-like hydrolase/transferase [Proteiniphilum saccharofermentans]|uniref:sulfatase-like hydrolase/transferase n=1 Tax=Proteiniphilum saccharofermentans TaxID=1642647 RepID=UPI0028A6AC14|nr:sulfatase-like hydrolase/transferase [Proteiniphilum saccharofermentans]